MTTPAIYRQIPSHFANKYAVSTGYSNMSQGLSDALDCFCTIMDMAPHELGMWQGCYNPHGPDTSAGYHHGANCVDLVLPSPGSVTDRWVKTLSFIGIAGWVRDQAYAHGGMKPRHFHGFALHMMNRTYVNRGIVAQQEDYLDDGDGLVGSGRDYHDHLRPSFRSVHFMGKAKSARAVVTADTHSYTEPGKLKSCQDKARPAGYQITNAVCTVRVWVAEGKSVDMLVTSGLRFYDLSKVKFA